MATATNNEVNASENKNKQGVKNNVSESVLKFSRDMTKEEISKLQKFQVKIVKKFNKKYNQTSYNLFVRFSGHVHGRIKINDVARYYNVIDELKSTKYKMKKEEFKDIETIYINDVPVRTYHVINDLENINYKKYNVFLTENEIFTNYFSKSEAILVSKENKDIKFITVTKDSEVDEKGDDIGSW
ncbi:hypothetical protein KHQ81_10905 [Mycoplasmatota bacterium]|nr:hypothetical protein KHQ81_10905 [Mycoplasmatota bacterium]